MDAIRLGLSLRALRIRRRLRQVDQARLLGVSRGTVSNLERGRVGHVTLDVLVRAAAALGADVDVRIRWRGEHLDRLLDEGHAALADAFVRFLDRFGWETALEVTFAIYGERGSIDILAFHRSSATLVVVEIKTVIPDLQSMIATLDRKARHAPDIARTQGWQARTIGRLLVVAEGSTNRDRVGRFEASLAGAFPARGRLARSWIRQPRGPIAGLLFFRSETHRGVARGVTGVQRVRPVHPSRNATHRQHSGTTRRPR